MLASIPPGVKAPPLPELYGLDADFARASANTLEIHDGDDARLAQLIESVAWAKLDLAGLVKQGWKPGEVLVAMAQQHNDEATLRADAAKALKQLLASGDMDVPALGDELQTVNKELAERGLPEITPAELGVTEE
jgi:hypothetical protein